MVLTDNPSMVVPKQSCTSLKQNRAKKKRRFEGVGCAGKSSRNLLLSASLNCKRFIRLSVPRAQLSAGWAMCRADANPGPRQTHQKPGPRMWEGGAVQYNSTKLDMLDDNRKTQAA